MRRLRTELGHAVAVAIVGGFVLGLREALLTTQASAFAQPGQYLLLFLTVPIVSWVVLALLLVVPLACLWAVVNPDNGASVVTYVGILTVAGALAAVLPAVEAIAGQLRELGVASGILTYGVLFSIAATLSGAAAMIAAAAAQWYQARPGSGRAMRLAVWLVLMILLLCLFPIARFLITDWKRAASDVASADDTTSPRPNVLLISIDTLRADHLGAYGDSRGLTPNMDRLAAEAVVFERAVTSAPWTLPAMASLMTGLYPHHHGAGQIVNGRDPLGRSALATGTPTLASLLKAHGYRTHAIVTNPYLALAYGFGDGFETYENLSIESEAWLAFERTTAVRLLTAIRPQLLVGDRGATVSARATQWLQEYHGNRPFLLWLHYIDPHPPYSRPGVTRHKSFRGDTLLGSTGDVPFPLISPDIARLRSGEIRLDARDKQLVHDLYRDEVASVDSAVGVVLDRLTGLGLAQNTLVILVADHGEEFWEHGGVEHGRTVYEEVIRIPLVMRWPARLRAERVAHLVGIIDVMPTIAALLDLPDAPQLDGRRLLPLAGAASSPRSVIIENMLFAEERVGLRTPEHKYVRWETGKEEAYFLANDATEQRDLAAIDAVANPLRALFAANLASHPQDRAPARAPELDDAARQALRSLGYLQ
jgi:arylsulfatase A-like enzyme